MTVNYSVIYLPQSEKFFKKAPRNISSHIFKNIAKVSLDPFAPNNNLTKLKDPIEGYRLRVGDYRTIYILNKTKKQLIVVKIDHRSAIYR